MAPKMEMSGQILGLLYLLLFTCAVSTAQPARDRGHRRYLHLGRALNAEHVHTHRIRLLSTKDDPLHANYRSKLALRSSALTIFERIESAEIERTHLERRKENNAEIQQKIDELDTAFQSLIALLAADYGVTFGSSSETSSSASSIPTEVSMPPPGSTFTGITSVDSSAATPLGSLEAASTATATTPSQPLATPESDTSSLTYIFNATSPSNVAVYYGQTDRTSAVPLVEVCSDLSVDIIILAFVNNFFTPYPTGPYPTLNMGPHCWAASSAQISAGASGLIDCVSDGFAELVRACQTTYGKKVLLSLGGAVGDTRIPDDTGAIGLADTIWDLFLGGSGQEAVRPFGDVVLDGIDIDIDNEDPANAAHLPALINSLRQNFANAQDVKPYYLSAAPQCVRPDQSIPLQSMQTQIDFVWPQFYNNPSCNLDSAGFIPALQGWASDLSTNQQSNDGDVTDNGFVDIGNGVTSPRLLVGAPAFANAGNGFVEGAQFEEIVARVRNTSLGGQTNEASPFGGFMFWDGAYGVESAEADGTGVSYMQIVKDVLSGP